jgi:hypothetical protein
MLPQTYKDWDLNGEYSEDKKRCKDIVRAASIGLEVFRKKNAENWDTHLAFILKRGRRQQHLSWKVLSEVTSLCDAPMHRLPSLAHNFGDYKDQICRMKTSIHYHHLQNKIEGVFECSNLGIQACKTLCQDLPEKYQKDWTAAITSSRNKMDILWRKLKENSDECKIAYNEANSAAVRLNERILNNFSQFADIGRHTA